MVHIKKTRLVMKMVYNEKIMGLSWDYQKLLPTRISRYKLGDNNRVLMESENFSWDLNGGFAINSGGLIDKTPIEFGEW